MFIRDIGLQFPCDVFFGIWLILNSQSEFLSLLFSEIICEGLVLVCIFTNIIWEFQ